DLFLEKLLAGGDIAIAQRSKKIVYPNLARRAVALVSRFIIGNLILPGIRDTQAGYKGFRRDIALYLFPRLKTNRFLFDLELLFMAHRKNLRIEKVYVDWIDRPGSTVRIGRDTIRSTMELFLILFWGSAGAYQLNEPVE